VRDLAEKYPDTPKRIRGMWRCDRCNLGFVFRHSLRQFGVSFFCRRCWEIEVDG
jgi:hypothetical protein